MGLFVFVGRWNYFGSTRGTQPSYLDGKVSAALGQGPGLRADDLTLAVGDKVHDQADDIVERRVGALVDEGGGQGEEGDGDEAELEGPVEGGPREEAERPLEAEHGDAQHEVDDLEGGERLDRAVEVGGEEVPEDLGPEEAVDCGGYLV